MWKKLKGLLEGIAYAGMSSSNPRQTGAQSARPGIFGGIRQRLEGFISGKAPDSPLYLTNRTIGQRLRFGLVVALPLVVIVAAVWYVSLGHKVTAPPRELTPAEIAAGTLPTIDPKVDGVSSDLKITEVQVNHAEPPTLVGNVSNVTDKVITLAEFSFDLTDVTGSQVGAAAGKMEKLAPKESRRFEIPIKPRDASYALVREVRTE
jgi:hypothetical protein